MSAFAGVDGAIWSIGAGNMGGAMLRRWLASGLAPERLTVIRRSAEAFAPGVTTLDAPPPDGPPPALLLLAVKPHMIDDVAGRIAGMLVPGTILVSILAGVEIASLRARFPAATIVRAMPNMPVAIGQGVVGLHMTVVDDPVRRTVEALMAPLGLVEWIADEAQFDAVTALAGSGPAFLYRFIDALAVAGFAAGLPRDQAARLALATVAGAAALATSAGEDPAMLAERVASPGGSTRKGLDVLDDRATGNLVDLLTRTIAAAIARNVEMAAAARG